MNFFAGYLETYIDVRLLYCRGAKKKTGQWVCRILIVTQLFSPILGIERREMHILYCIFIMCLQREFEPSTEVVTYPMVMSSNMEEH